MNNTLRRILTGAAGLVVISATVIIFFIGFMNSPKEKIDNIAFTFTIISEVVFFAGLIFIDIFKNIRNRVLFNSGITTTLALYLIITIANSIFLPGMLKGNTYEFVTIQSIVIALAAIIILCIFIVSVRSGSEIEEVTQSSRILKECENIVFKMMNCKNCKAFEKPLSDLYDALKYSDLTDSLEKEENEINAKIMDLDDRINDSCDNACGDIKSSIDEIILLVKNRNMLLKQSKQGGY